MRTEDEIRENAEDLVADSAMAGLLQGTSFSGGERDATFVQDADGRYRDLSLISGLAHHGDGRVLVRADFDRDGWTDLALANANAPLLRLSRNRLGELSGERARVLSVSLEGGMRPGLVGLSPRTPYGARVTLRLEGRSLVRELRCGEGMGAQNSAVLQFGLDGADRVLGGTVHWTSGRTTEFGAAESGDWLTLSETEGLVDRRPWIVNGDGAPAAAVPAPAEPTPFFADRVAAADGDLNLFVFMGTWCSSCVREIPSQRELVERLGPGAVAVHGLSDHQGEERELRDFEARHAPPYRIEGLDADAAASFAEFCARERIQYAVPMHVVTDSAGAVLYAGRDLPTLSDLRGFGLEGSRAR